MEKSGSLLLDSLGELVEQVYHFKDHYFEDHDLEEAAAKSDKAIFCALANFRFHKIYIFCTTQKIYFALIKRVFLHLTIIYSLNSQKLVFSLSKSILLVRGPVFVRQKVRENGQ